MAKDQTGPLLQDSQLFCIQTDMPIEWSARYVNAGRIVQHLFRKGPDLQSGQYGFYEERSIIDAI